MVKVILLQSVRKLGRKFDEVNVKTGFAQNFLFPQKVAVPAVEPFLSGVLSQKTQQQSELDAQKTSALEIFEKVTGKTISVKVKANETGGLYRSLSEKEVAKIASTEFGFEIPEDLILMKNPIKALGEYDIDCFYNEAHRTAFILQVLDEQKKKILKEKSEELEEGKEDGEAEIPEEDASSDEDTSETEVSSENE